MSCAALFVIPRSEVCMGFPAFLIWSMFPLRATQLRRPLPLVVGSPASEYYETIWLPYALQTFFVLLNSPTCMIRRHKGLPSSWRFSFSVPCSLTPTGLQGSRLALNANLCSATMRFRSLCIGFRFPNVVATCICSYEAELLQEGANFLTAHRIPCVRFVWVVRLCVSPSQSRNTQYGWLAMPLPMRTFTSSENVKLRLAH